MKIPGKIYKEDQKRTLNIDIRGKNSNTNNMQLAKLGKFLHMVSMNSCQCAMKKLKQGYILVASIH